jgi:hypothetical protein
MTFKSPADSIRVGRQRTNGFRIAFSKSAKAANSAESSRASGLDAIAGSTSPGNRQQLPAPPSHRRSARHLLLATDELASCPSQVWNRHSRVAFRFHQLRSLGHPAGWLKGVEY